jgi:hypothetical protein
MADLDPLGQFPNSFMAIAAKLGQSRFYSTENTFMAAPITWSTTDLLNITLSNANLTATTPGVASGAVRGTKSLSSGKYYWEYVINSIFSNQMSMGVASASAVLSSVNNTGIQASYVQRSGNIYANSNISLASLGPRAVNDAIGIAVDFTAALIWFRVAPVGNWNNSGTANPATGVGGFSISALTGALYPLISFPGIGVEAITMNSGASAFSGAVPSGFTSGFLA